MQKNLQNSETFSYLYTYKNINKQQLIMETQYKGYTIITENFQSYIYLNNSLKGCTISDDVEQNNSIDKAKARIDSGRVKANEFYNK